jgi:ATP-dependent DNA helicase RecQ
MSKKIQVNSSIHDILHQYWGYSEFRPLQEDIIRSVIDGKDTLALMPTGGGKSITFQVPALAMEGICLVITPLISLMKDQVENLCKRQIKAIAIHSGMTRDEIDVALNNCIYGAVKFLYLSPERLSTEILKVRMQKMKVNLIAVDEAHCISQWGYDFRPSYLKIAELREHLPNVTILALTATATPKVAEDIMDKLRFVQPNLLSKSFERKNLAYVVRQTPDKQNQILKIIKRVQGCGIIYVRNRKKTKEIAYFLKKQGVSANYYHAGLNDKERAARQDQWKNNSTRIIVATNAFGMGIDKPDVRFVIHYEPPDSLESYFQEAGRAGRDGQKSFAIMLCDEKDQVKLEKSIDVQFPEISSIKSIYQMLGNFLNIPYGGGKDLVFDFDLASFCASYNLAIITTYNSLKILQNEGYIEFNEDVNNPSKVHFVVGRNDLYKFQVANAAFDGFIKLMLRSYAGLFTDYVIIDELSLAKRSKVSLDEIRRFLNKLTSLKVIKYIPHKNTPLVTYTEERLDDKTLYISHENFNHRKNNFTTRIQKMIRYAFSQDECRSRMLLAYFGQQHAENCGICDVCIAKNEMGLSYYEFEQIKKIISEKLVQSSLQLQQLVDVLNLNEEKVIKVIRWLLDNDYLCYMEDQTISLKNLT